ncbi:MAG: acyl-CoA/acyl-ACP dehydrogenase [Desulfobacteraceae bacterium]|nr:acyl-CoA/acyl-ACP dehydrogenase [Desulfobacteraceae bacterium]
MDFELNKSQKEIQKAARDFAKGEFDKDTALELEKNSEFPKKIWEKAAELGFIGIHFDDEYSGGGLGLLENAVVAEEFCRKDSSIGTALMLAGFASECLLRFGENGLKEKFLPKIAEGQIISAGAFFEPGHGFELAALETSAVKHGDQWLINGTKTNVTNGGSADFYIVLCRTNPDAEASKGLSMILVEADRQGVSPADTGPKLGHRMSAMADVSFEDVRVPVSNLIGKEGEGLSQAHKYLDENRILCAAVALGTARGAFERATDYVRQRGQFGRKIAEFEITRHKLAEMALKIELARLVTYKAAWNYDKGSIDPVQTSMARLYSTRAAVEVADEAVQLHGGYGYMTEYEIEHFYRDAKVTEIWESTGAIQKNTIADSVIGRIKN